MDMVQCGAYLSNETVTLYSRSGSEQGGTAAGARTTPLKWKPVNNRISCLVIGKKVNHHCYSVRFLLFWIQHPKGKTGPYY